MSSLTVLASIAALWAMAVVSPGPNFFVTARLSVARSRGAALDAVKGIGIGTALWALAGCFGVQALFAVAPWLYLTIKVSGALYLMFVGGQLLVRSLRRARDDDPDGLSHARFKLSPFQLGLLTTLANPRSAVTVASIFATTMPPNPTFALSAAVMLLMIGLSVAWYAGIAFLFTTRHLAEGFRRFRRWIDRVAGVCLMAFGVRLAFDR